ncbi:MAG TPA: FAD-dependent oxidoreductase [Sulfurimonas sp.]|uniref:FAD-dependent oxidoreductase n=1 Tax=Sulfurimonas sp. TaxID=2022749 RepID=UPI002B6D7C2B|nr:FAD-dependent oxidoreductase [Sulfurimonas sp.]HUH42853.1 FAD-dependent oxidoreductase [Sulfurimonas sp.]
MKIYDFLIIGAGSGGCNCAAYLKQRGLSVAIADKEGVASGGSGAAGAFLSPLAGVQNSYNRFINSALEYSLEFYEKMTPNSIVKKGVLRVENNNFNSAKLQTNSIKNSYISAKELQEISQNFAQIDGYFYENAAILNPHEVCQELIKECDFYNYNVKELKYEDGFYIFDDFKAKNIILAQGVIKPIVETPYIKIAPIFGVKIDVKTTTKVPFNIHKSISVSTNKKDSTISIGATKERHDTSEMECLTSCDKCAFYVNSEQGQVEELLKDAIELIKLEDVEVTKVYRGARATIKSYFPVIGKVIDYEQSLKKYPSIKNGTKIPPELLTYFENLYIINALGSRGFVVAPMLAKLLCEEILDSKKVPQELSSEKLFYKMARTKVST